ncbi:MAG: VOC family protein [Cyanobacteria bacterium J06597_1]
MTPSTALLSIATPNLPSMQAFYCALLDTPPAVVLDNTYLEFRLAGFRLGLYRSNNPEYRACLGASSLCLQVEDLDAMLALPVLQSVSISSLRSEFHGREVDFCDPDGNRIVIHEPSQAFWDLMQVRSDAMTGD